VRECNCAGCGAGLEPFTTEHFRVWAAELELDSGDIWDVEPFQSEMLEDLFSGLFQVVWFVVPEGNAKTTAVSRSQPPLRSRRTSSMPRRRDSSCAAGACRSFSTTR
jgi:hypothetical protein